MSVHPATVSRPNSRPLLPLGPWRRPRAAPRRPAPRRPPSFTPYEGTEPAMRRRDGRYECAECGALLDIPPNAHPKAMIKVSDSRPNIRVLTLGGREIHRCDIATLQKQPT